MAGIGINTPRNSMADLRALLGADAPNLTSIGIGSAATRSDLPPGDEELCTPVRTIRFNPGFTLPGGIDLKLDPGMFPEIPDLNEMMSMALMVMNSALIPLMPIFNIIDAVIAVFECIKAIPDALVTLDPSKMTDCLAKLEKVINTIISMIPALSVPRMVVQIFDSLIAFILGIREKLIRMLKVQVNFGKFRAQAAAAGNVALSTIVDCAERNFSVELEFLNSKLDPVNRLIGIVNKFLELIGIDTGLKCISLDLSLSFSIVPIDVALYLLFEIRGLVLKVPFLHFNKTEEVCDPEENTVQTETTHADGSTTTNTFGFGNAELASQSPAAVQDFITDPSGEASENLADVEARLRTYGQGKFASETAPMLARKKELETRSRELLAAQIAAATARVEATIQASGEMLEKKIDGLDLEALGLSYTRI